MITVQSLIGLVIALVVLAAVVTLINYIVDHIPIDNPLGRVIKVVALVICCLTAIILLLQFAGLTTIGP